MLRLLSDENFNGDIVRGLLLRHPALDLHRVQDGGLEEADDPTILAWAAVNDRIVVTHDHATMPDFAYARVVAGQPMPGVVVVPDRMAVRQVIEELLLVEACSEQAEWAGLVVYLPLYVRRGISPELPGTRGPCKRWKVQWGNHRHPGVAIWQGRLGVQ
jgi:predicted nuclease of predicted toxin-antitoxin system